jgi:hypothetical protein
LSAAAQCRQPTKEETARLNSRIEWQMKNTDRGLNYVPLDMAKTKLYIMVDASFANNKDLSSQIGYIIILGNEKKDEKSFKLVGNIVHWSSTKCKRVTRSVLASEVYGMANGVNMAVAIGTTFNIVTQRLEFSNIPIIICTNSFSLYECFVKLGTIKEKKLIIDIMAIQQAYEQKDVFEIRWINGQNNSANAITKAKPNRAISNLIDTNRLRLRVQGWIHRKPEKDSDVQK